MEIEIPRRFAGPPSMGHGGYVAGLFASRTTGPVQVTLRRPTPLDTPLDLVATGGARLELRHGDVVVAESEPVAPMTDLVVPAPPSLEAARAAEPDSPARYNGRGVHPTCFGCGQERDGDALRIAAGPVEVAGVPQVAGTWLPGAAFAGDDGTVDAQWVLAALDCPGAFAFIASGTRAGLLGRIVFEQHAPVPAAEEHVVTGWRIADEGRKLFAGTALFSSGGSLLAAARATWFQMGGAG
jgi:hypothetical protein